MHSIKPRRLALALALLATVFAVVGVSPVAAGGAHDTRTALGCNWDVNGEVFDSISAVTAGAAAARGSEPREPVLNEPVEALPADAPVPGPGFSATVPVNFHVIHDGGTGNVTQSQIDDQIRILNLGFAGFYGGANTGFQFTLAGVTRTDNAEWFNAGPGTPAEREMKKALGDGDLATLDYYSTTASGFLGWAYFPGLPEPRQYLDGIVVDWESMFKTSPRYEGRFDLGFTAVHEAGHWFELFHTFQGGCNAKGDHIDDTPAMKVPSSRCPEGNDTCTKDPGLDPIHNFMDYSDDPCYTQFTAGQTARMQASFVFFRA
jgi:hypothetical protein